MQQNRPEGQLEMKVVRYSKSLYMGLEETQNNLAEEDMSTEQKFKLLKQDRISRSKGCNLYIKNLDDVIDDEKLHKEFSPFGSIISAKVILVEGCSTGVGFVCFSSPDEAMLAVTEMNGRVVGTKPIYVALFQSKEERKAHFKACREYWRGVISAEEDMSTEQKSKLLKQERIRRSKTQTPSDVMPKRDQGRDMELDKKIEALRRKNEALMKRYQEVEADKKRAEEDALQSRKGKVDDLTVTISKSTSDTRVVTAKPGTGGSPEAGPDGLADDPYLRGSGRGRRQQLLVTMARKKGKRVVSEKPETRPGPQDAQSPLEEDGPPQRPAESAGRGKQTPPHTAKREPAAAQDEARQLQRVPEESCGLSEHWQEHQLGTTDLTVPTTKEEQEEYLRWKKEREQIDRERVARHKNAKGQWRRAWDMDKTENMFSEKAHPERDRGPPCRGGRNARRGNSRSNADSRGHETRSKGKGAKNVPVVSSTAKGKDRLTGRARRWDANEEGEHVQNPESSLEDFLEELDALMTDPEVGDHRDQDNPKVKMTPTPEAMCCSDSEGTEVSGGPTCHVSTATAEEDNVVTLSKTQTSSPRAAEKKVRFSEELILGSHTMNSDSTTNAACSETRAPRSLKISSPSKIKTEMPGPKPQPLEIVQEDDGSAHDQGEQSSVCRQRVSGDLVSEAESTVKDSPLASPLPPVKACDSLQNPVQPVEHAKSTISNRNAEELIDSGLSVLSLESGETCPTHTTSSDKARENGKIV